MVAFSDCARVTNLTNLERDREVRGPRPPRLRAMRCTDSCGIFRVWDDKHPPFPRVIVTRWPKLLPQCRIPWSKLFDVRKWHIVMECVKFTTDTIWWRYVETIEVGIYKIEDFSLFLPCLSINVLELEFMLINQYICTSIDSLCGVNTIEMWCT